MVISFIFFYTKKGYKILGEKKMKKLLVALFLVLILAFSFFGYSQTTDHSVEVVDQNSYFSIDK